MDAGAEFGIKPCGLGRAQHAAAGSEDGALRPRDRRLHLAARRRTWLDRQTRQRAISWDAKRSKQQRAEGVKRKLAGFEMRGRGIGRDGYEVRTGRRAGRLGDQRRAVADARTRTSACVTCPWSTLSAGRHIQVIIRNQPVDAVTVETPFYKRAKMTYYPENLPYTKEHEWVRVEGDTGTVGHHRPCAAGTRRYRVRGSAEGGRRRTSRAESLGSVESVKAVSDIYSPVSGESRRDQRRAGRRAGEAERGSSRRGLAC